MKKILLFIIAFFIIPNVNAMTCTYNSDNVSLSIEVNVNSYAGTWLKAYNFGGESSGGVSDDVNMGSGGTVIAPNQTEIFGRFDSFGTAPDEGTCPVLVSIGGGQYTVMPYDAYTTYFAPDATIECSDCCKDEEKTKCDVVRALSAKGVEKKYTFDDICKYFTTYRNDAVSEAYGYTANTTKETVPFLGYLYYSADYKSTIKKDCDSYLNGSGGMSPSKKSLKDYFSSYKDQIIPGEVETSSEYSVCPSVDSVNETEKILECFSDKTERIKEVIKDFSEKCTEREKRAIQLYSGGSVAQFFSKHGVSGYLDNEIKMLFNSFSSECGAAADKLYNAINNGNRVTNAYGRQANIRNSMTYLYFESNYLSALGLLTQVNSEVDIEEDACNLISDSLRDIIKEILDGLRVGAVILVVLLSIIDVYKSIIGDDSARKKMPSLVTKRIIAVVILLLLPALVLGLIDLLNKYVGMDSSKCVISDINGS